MIDDLFDEPDYDEGPDDGIIDQTLDDSQWTKCACPFCHCSVKTKAAICDMCLDGAHQG